MASQSQVFLDSTELPSTASTTNKRASGDATHVAERPKKRTTCSNKNDLALSAGDGDHSTVHVTGQLAVGSNGRLQRNREQQVPPVQQLGNLSEILTAKPVRGKAKKQLQVVDSEVPNPMAGDVGTTKKSTSTRGARGGGRGGRGCGGKQGSVAHVPAGLDSSGGLPAIDFNALAALYNSLNNSPAQLSAFNTVTQQLLQAYPPDFSPNAGQGPLPQSGVHVQPGHGGNSAGPVLEGTQPGIHSTTNFMVSDQVHAPESSSSLPPYTMNTNLISQLPGLANSARTSITTAIPNISQPMSSATLFGQGGSLVSVQSPTHPHCGSLLSSLNDPNYSLGISDPRAQVPSESLQPNLVPSSFNHSSDFETASTLLDSVADNVAGVFAVRRSGNSGGHVLPQLPGMEDDSDDTGEGDDVDETGHEPEVDTDDNNEEEQTVLVSGGQKSLLNSGSLGYSAGLSLSHGDEGLVAQNTGVLRNRFDSMERELESDRIASVTGSIPSLASITRRTPPPLDIGDVTLGFSSQQINPLSHQVFSGSEGGLSQYQPTQSSETQAPLTRMSPSSIGVQANSFAPQSSSTFTQTQLTLESITAQRIPNHVLQSANPVSAQEIASRQIQLQLEAARRAESSLSIGNVNDHNVLDSFQTHNRLPRAPNPESLTHLGSFNDNHDIATNGLKTMGAYLNAGGAKRQRARRQKASTPSSSSRGLSAAPYCRAPSISAVSSMSQSSSHGPDEWRSVSDSTPTESTSVGTSSSVPANVRYKNLADLPISWQVVTRSSRTSFKEVVISGNAFLLRPQYQERIESIILSHIIVYEEEGGVMEGDLFKTHKDDLIEIVWKIVAIVRNDIKAICQLYVAMYDEMTPPPGSTAEEQIAYVVARVLKMAGDDVLFTGIEKDDPEGRAQNWCNPIFKKAVLQAFYIGKNKVATQSNSCRLKFGREVPVPGMALVATGMVCAFDEWVDGVRIDIPFDHPGYATIYNNMLKNIAKLALDTYQHEKMESVRQAWASEGMRNSSTKTTGPTRTVGSRVRY